MRCSRWRLSPINKMNKFLPLALETYRSTSQVILDVRNLFAEWFRPLLHQIEAKYFWSSLIKTWKASAKFIWIFCINTFFLGSRKVLRKLTPSNRTVPQLTQRVWLRNGARNVSKSFGTSKCGHLQVLISKPWTSLSRTLHKNSAPIRPWPEGGVIISSKWIGFRQSMVRRQLR